MSLAKYKKKRSFNKTPEPEGKKKASSGSLRFVVQKHDATRLHYDFRLEMEGVLKSWAVPKGPSMNPDDKRLAMMVEDHPFDYKDFEGIIPEGNYGAGTVIIWDEGTYEAMDFEGDPKKAEKHLLAQLQKGDVKITLHGQKLKGSFALVHIKSKEDNAWLLIKKRDKYASTADVTKKVKSVQSGMKLEQVAKESTNEWQSNKKSSTAKKSSTTTKTAPKATPTRTVAKKKAAVKKKVPAAIENLLKKGKRQAMPKGVIPMLATLTEGAFDDANWLFEIKYDGYRTVAYVDGDEVNIMSRKNLPFNKKFYPVVEALQELGMNAVLDGEIVALNKEGRSEFQLLQNWQKSGEGELAYYVFDILWLNGVNLMDLPLQERKSILQQVLPEHPMIRYSDHVVETGIQFFDAATQQGLEGIIAKEADSSYTPKARTKQWLKIKSNQRQEVVICGFTETRGSRSHFGALVLGVYENNKLIYVGHTGSGFNAQSLSATYKKLKPLVTSKTPFDKKPKTNMPCTWVKPVLVCEVKFSEWTQDNILRQPIFMGLREDKNAKDVHKENAADTETAVQEAEEETQTAAKRLTQNAERKMLNTKNKTAMKRSTPNTKRKTAAEGSRPKAEGKRQTAKTSSSKAKTLAGFLNDTDKEQILIINKKELTFTNLHKIYWPKEKISKRGLLNYYHQIAPFILPYLKDRPQSMNRFPNGVGKPNFYQKDVSDKVADWIEKHDYIADSDGEKKQYLVCTDEASLLYMANLGCIEMNPWHSTTKKPENPSWCVIDLDPAGKITFDQVIEAAQVIKQVTDDLEIDTYCKTSGSTGLHIYIPLGALYDYDQSRQLAELIVNLAHNEMPSFTSLERSPAKRRNKIYLDFLQNRKIQTIASPYSLRPKPGATASAPLHWEEVKKGLQISDFSINNMYSRAKEVGDIFKPVLGKGINLKKVLGKISTLQNG